MGDVGSLALGGMLGTIAVMTRQELAFAIMGGVFVVEALSVILQVGSYKLRKKRIFLMAPLHHHFEMLNWKETQVVNASGYSLLDYFDYLGGDRFDDVKITLIKK